MTLRYQTVQVTEGGANFNSYSKWEDVPFSVNQWWNTDGGEALKEELAKAELGDEIFIDGNTVCYVLKEFLE